MTCPLPWSRVLCMRPPVSAADRRAVEPWLRAAGWHFESGSWRDPVSRNDWTLHEAAQRQASREVQPLLEPRGWRIADGCQSSCGVWLWARKVYRRGRLNRAVSAATALQNEGLDAQTSLWPWGPP